MKHQAKNKKIWIAAVAAAVLLGGVGGSYYYVKIRPSQSPNQVSTPIVKPSDETRLLIEKIGRLIVLPTDEEPTIATVEDPKKLKAQAFVANAKQGDKVLIYSKSRQAILYSPTQD